MAIFKRLRCKGCNYNTTTETPQKTLPLCAKCGGELYYSQNWYISYYQNSKKMVVSVAPQKKLAEDALAKIKSGVREGKFFTKQKIATWDETVKQFTAWAKVNIKPTSARRYGDCLKSLTPFFGKYTLPEINLGMIEQYKSMRISAVTASTVNHDITCLKRIFSLAEEWGLIENNQIRKAKMIKENSERTRFLSDEEIGRLLVACTQDYLKLAVTIALNTGMRREGVLCLKWEEISFKRKVIRIKSKGDKEVSIPITEHLERVLLEKRKENNLSPYVIPSERVKGAPIRDLKNSFKKALGKAGIKDFRFHDLRHTFASHFLMTTKDLKALQEILGHADIQTTMKYSHLLDEHKQGAMDIFSSRKNWTTL